MSLSCQAIDVPPCKEFPRLIGSGLGDTNATMIEYNPVNQAIAFIGHTLDPYVAGTSIVEAQQSGIIGFFNGTMMLLQWLKSIEGISEFATVGFSSEGNFIFALSNNMIP